MTDSLTEAVKSYYNSKSATFFDIWGGEYIHYGIYTTGDESLEESSRATVARMADMIRPVDGGARIVDLGSGFGSAARFLTRRGHRVTCVDLSAENNRVNRELNEKQGVEGIEIIENRFESLPLPDGAFDAAWSQEAICHSTTPELVFREVKRLLRPGGQFLMSNTCHSPTIPDAELETINRRNPVDLKTVQFYTDLGESIGLRQEERLDLAAMLPTHYEKMIANTQRNEAALVEREGAEQYARILKGLRYWQDITERGYLDWAVWSFTRD